MPFLTVLTGDDPGRVHSLSPDREFVIGRGGFCDIVLAHSTISRQHARVFCDGGRYFIEDLGSINGTFVDGQQIRRATPLKDGAMVNIYEVPLRFHLHPVVHAPVPETDGLAEKDVVGLNLTVDKPVDERLRRVLEINRQLSSSLELDTILPKILDDLFEMFPNVINGQILLLDSQGELVARALKHGREGDSRQLTMRPLRMSIAKQVLETMSPAISDDTPEEDSSVFDEQRRSTLCVPLISPTHLPLGVIQLESEGGSGFDETDQAVMMGVATVAAQSLELARQQTERGTADYRRRQMATAREVQMTMLPSHRPEIPGYGLADYYRPAEDVGGDYFSYCELADGIIAISIADVCGKGLSAALLMAELSSEVRHTLETAPSVKVAMSRLNQHFVGRSTSFVTFLLCILDPHSHTLTVVNAGHPPPLRRCGEDPDVESLEIPNGGLPLGVSPTETYHPFSVPMEPGDLFVLYTDGITEAYRIQNELYGIKKLCAALRESALDANAAVRAVITDIDRFRGGHPQSDDMCVVAFQRLT